jgi:hypothetical protein
MPEFLIILSVVGAFLGIFWLASVLRERRQLTREERRAEPRYRKAA